MCCAGGERAKVGIIPVVDGSNVEKPDQVREAGEIRTVVATHYLLIYLWSKNRGGPKNNPIPVLDDAGTAFETPPCR